jgi:hypothetical protein
MNFCLYFPHLLSDLGKFSTGGLLIMLFSTGEFRENWPV